MSVLVRTANARGTIVWASILVLVVAPPAVAETFVCDDGFCFLGPTDVLDNVVVRGDGILLLEGTLVTGNMKVEEGGTLATSGAMIAGNVVAHEATLVSLVLTLIDGNVQIKRTGGDPVFGLLPSADLVACEVRGNVQIKDNDVNFITLLDNDIDGNLQLKGNLALLPIGVTDNFIAGNLQCKDNDPPPTGSGNFVEGNIQGQCEGLGL